MKEKFLSRVADYILESTGTGRPLVLLPTRRSRVYLQEELKQKSGQDKSAAVWTLEDWLKNKSTLKLIEPLEQLLALYELHRERGGAQTADEFFGMGEVMLADFNEVDLQMAAAKLFFNYLEQLQSMKVYVPGEDELSEYSLKYRQFWSDFKALYFALREKLAANNKGYLGMIYRQLAEDANLLGDLPRKIFIVGFSSLNKCEEKIIQYLVKEGVAEVIWDYDKYYAQDGFQEAGIAFREYERQLKVKADKWLVDEIATAPKQIKVIGVAKNVGQTRVAADIVANKLGLNEHTEKETAIVVLDNKLLNPLISSVSPFVSAMNVSMGLPLNATPMAELLKIIFSLQENLERFSAKESRIRYYFRDVFDLLQHPYTKYLLPDKAVVAQFIEKMKKFNRMAITVAELEATIGKETFELLFWNPERAEDYLNKLLNLLAALDDKFRPRPPEDVVTDVEWLRYFVDIATEIKTAVGPGSQVSVQALRKLLLEHVRSQTVPFEGEPVRGLQLMGILETRCLDFKNVVILSMNEGILPASKTQNTYIPYELRKEFLTTHKDRDANAAYLFYRLLQRAENVYLLYNTEPDELGGGEKSRFIIQLQHELEQKNPQTVLSELVYSVDPPAALIEDSIIIPKTEELLDTFYKNNQGHGISPSAINTYINCTLQYYFRYIARLREQDDIEESMEASTLGSAVHEVLEKLYKEVKGQDLNMPFLEKISKDKARINSLLKEFFHERFDDESLRRGKNYLLFRVCGKLIEEFLKWEKKNLQMLDDSGVNMKVEMLENEMEMDLQVRGHAVKIKGKVDRVEIIGDVIQVADYKTGTALGSKISAAELGELTNNPEYAKAMQLLNYAWLYWRNTGAKLSAEIRSGIYWLRDSQRGLDTLKLDSGDVINGEVLLQFEEVLRSVLAELTNPDIPFQKTEDVERCVNCEFARICRRN